MLSKSRNFTRYNDGCCSILRDETPRNAFSAAVNAGVSDMTEAGTLFFHESGIRERDYEFAEQRGFNLSRKIECYNVPWVDPECKALIDGVLYDVSYIDRDKVRMFVYLEGGRYIDD